VPKSSTFIKKSDAPISAITFFHALQEAVLT